MTMLERLLDILLTEMVSEEKRNLTYSLCMHSLNSVRPYEIDTDKTFVKSQDDERLFVSVTMKNGTELTVPLMKRYYRYGKHSGHSGVS